jgi:hypothetical protein
MKTVIAIIITLILTGCASTKLTSFVDPDFTNTTYKKVLIFYPSSDLDEKKEAEAIYREAFLEYGIKTFSSIELFPPTRNLSVDNMIEIMKEKEIDAVLFVEFTDAWTDASYVPETQTTTKKGNVNVFGNTATYKEKSTTYTSGGYYINKPRIQFVTRLVNLEKDHIAWIGSSLTKGNAFAKFHKLISSLAETTIEDLIKNKLVIPVNQNN